MNRDLDLLLAWSRQMAATDDDHDARALWEQIAREVEAYVTDMEPPSAEWQTLELE